jgi:hypothetical protein
MTENGGLADALGQIAQKLGQEQDRGQRRQQVADRVLGGPGGAEEQ